MTATEIENTIRLISKRLTEIDDHTPEMTGMDWANDHGWISSEEWHAADEKSRDGVALQNDEVAKIEALRTSEPQATTKFTEALLLRMKKTQQQLETAAHAANKQSTEFAMRFNLALLPDIIATIEDWHRGKEPRHWLAWAWRVVFRIVEECEKSIGHG